MKTLNIMGGPPKLPLPWLNRGEVFAKCGSEDFFFGTPLSKHNGNLVQNIRYRRFLPLHTAKGSKGRINRKFTKNLSVSRQKCRGREVGDSFYPIPAL